MEEFPRMIHGEFKQDPIYKILKKVLNARMSNTDNGVTALYRTVELLTRDSKVSSDEALEELLYILLDINKEQSDMLTRYIKHMGTARVILEKEEDKDLPLEFRDFNIGSFYKTKKGEIYECIDKTRNIDRDYISFRHTETKHAMGLYACQCKNFREVEYEYPTE